MSRATLREVYWAVALALVATVGLDLLGGALPFVRANLVALFAFVFLWVPQFLLPRGGPGPEEYGLTWRGFGRGAALGLGLALLTLVGFLPGQHLWATQVLGAEFHPDAGAYVRPDDRNHGEAASTDDGRVHYFHLYEVHYVRWTPTQGPWRLTIDTDGELWRPDHSALGRQLTLSGEDPRPVAASFRTTGGTHVAVSAVIDGRGLARDDFAVGPGASQPREREWSDDGLRMRMSVAWLPLSVLFQLLLIALPEEFFYRGYLQRRLDQASERRRVFALGPIEISRSNLIVSLLFGLGHFVIGFDPLRLAVFFPSLLFGWLRDRSDGIAAPVVFHACCNLMVQVVAVHYW